MLCRKCIQALNCEDVAYARKVARNWRSMEGAMELWQCPKCGKKTLTEMRSGERKDSGAAMVTNEKQEIIGA